jgi:thiol-disulfide isomerase/thioredoxin
MLTVLKSSQRKSIGNKHLQNFISSVFVVVLCCAFISCGGNGAKTQQEEFQSASAALDGIGEESPGDSVDSAYLKSMIHSGRNVLLNFCYCCDCKFTKPILQAAIEKCGIPISMITVDVKEDFDIADEYGVKQSPFYILFDETGQQVDTLYGFQGDDLMDSAGIREWLEKNFVEPKGK